MTYSSRFARMFALLAVLVAVVLACTSCEISLDKLLNRDTATTEAVTTTDAVTEAPVCVHTPSAESTIVPHEGGYAYRHTCTVCGEPVYEELTVISLSDKWLYDEEIHWNDMEYEANLQSSMSNAHHKINTAAHDYDEKGECRGCHYKKTASEGLAYEESADGEGYVVIGRGECKDKHINIPDMHNEKPVVGIGDGAFANNGRPATEETPDEGTEEDTTEVEELVIVGITIPDTVVTISCTAFTDCEVLNNFIVNVENEVFKSENNCLIDSVNQSLVRGCEFSIIPEDGSVTAIGSYAFAGCEALITVTIPDSIETIGDKAFYECEALVEVRLPENVNIGVDVFRGSIHVEIKIDHTLVFVAAKEATCEEPGNIEHYTCEDCDHLFEDKEGKTRLYNVEIPAAHSFVEGVCEKCGEVLDSVLIVSIDEIPYLGKFALGTMENAIGLPAKVTVTTADGIRHELPVNWELSDYKKDTAGEYTIRGHIIAGSLHFAEGLTGEVVAGIEIVEFMKGTADIVFVLDISGSMGDEIANVKNNINSFSAAIEAEGVSARWGVITYSDFTVSGPNEESTIIRNGAADWFISADEYKVAIGSIVLAFGGDEPETAIDGLMLANTLSTRQDARVFYILLTDNECKVTNNYGVGSLSETADILANDGVNVSVIVPSGYTAHYSTLYNTTGGICANIYGNFGQQLLDSLVPIIQSEVAN